MPVSWSKEARARAKQDVLALVTIAIDGRTASPPFGMFAFEGPAPLEAVEALNEHLEQFLRDRNRWLDEMEAVAARDVAAAIRKGG